jgi:hypothetical protein
MHITCLRKPPHQLYYRPHALLHARHRCTASHCVRPKGLELLHYEYRSVGCDRAARIVRRRSRRFTSDPGSYARRLRTRALCAARPKSHPRRFQNTRTSERQQSTTIACASKCVRATQMLSMFACAAPRAILCGTLQRMSRQSSPQGIVAHAPSRSIAATPRAHRRFRVLTDSSTTILNARLPTSSERGPSTEVHHRLHAEVALRGSARTADTL